MRHLQSLPVRALKIDDSFVREAHRRAEAEAIARAIIAIADSFGLDVIAEGVETREELSLMRSIGCDVVQGFLVARPLRPEDVLAFVERYDRSLSFRSD